MVLASHIVFSTYGFWLPNDPRGSVSDYVRSKDLLPYGEATYVKAVRSVARKPHDPVIRRLAKETLKYSAVVLTGVQARSVVKGFKEAIATADMQIYGFALLPSHAHFVIARHRYLNETLVRLLKSAATRQLVIDGLHPFQHMSNATRPSPWNQKFWQRFLSTEEQIRQRINYVEQNPVKEGKTRQRWSFVKPFEWVG